MKNLVKLFGILNRTRSVKVPLLIIAIVALIGFSMAACDDGGGGGGGYYNPVPSAPTGLSASAGSSSEIWVTWNPVSGAEGYKLYSSASRNGTYYLQGSTTNTTVRSYGIPSGATRYFKVTAYNSYGESGYSNIDYATTW